MAYILAKQHNLDAQDFDFSKIDWSFKKNKPNNDSHPLVA